MLVSKLIVFNPSTFTNIFSSEMTVPIKLEFQIFLYSYFLRMPKRNFVHMTKMATKHIYGKNPLKVFRKNVNFEKRKAADKKHPKLPSAKGTTYISKHMVTKQMLVLDVLQEFNTSQSIMGAQWLSGRVLDWRPKGCGFEPHRHHCVVSLSKNINPSLVLVQPR